MTEVASDVDLVFWSLESWDAVWRRNQYVVAGLLGRFPRLRVLFVEPPVDPLHSLAQRERPRRGTGLRLVTSEGSGRLWAFQPTKAMPRAIGGQHVDTGLARQVASAAAHLGMSRPLLWVNDPHAAALVQRTQWPTVYDITDDWLLAERPIRHTKTLSAAEEVLLERAQVVTVCSPSLQASKSTSRPVHLVPNAVDLAALRTARQRPPDLPPGPIALYLGTIHEDRIDIRLCDQTATELRGIGTLVFVGPISLPRDRFLRMQYNDSIALLGARPREDVPGYLQHADVLVVPHRQTAFTDSLDPIKAYEYLAAGQPIVSTPVAGFREIDEPGVNIVTEQEFPAAVRRALELRGVEPSRKYHRHVPSWSDRVDTIVQILTREGLLPQNV